MQKYFETTEAKQEFIKGLSLFEQRMRQLREEQRRELEAWERERQRR
jgi:hypothetical protein